MLIATCSHGLYSSPASWCAGACNSIYTLRIFSSSSPLVLRTSSAILGDIVRQCLGVVATEYFIDGLRVSFELLIKFDSFTSTSIGRSYMCMNV